MLNHEGTSPLSLHNKKNIAFLLKSLRIKKTDDNILHFSDTFQNLPDSIFHSVQRSQSKGFCF